MKQRLKLLTFLVIVSVTFLFSAYSVSKQVISGVVEQLLWKYAQISAHHDAETLLAPIIKEVNIVNELASHPNVSSWGFHSDDEVYRAVAEDTLDLYRWRLKSKNFFVVLDQNLAYHYNDVQSVRKQTFLRYHLDPLSPKDQWYFEQKHNGSDLKVNIARDAHLGMTRLWINKRIEKGGQFLGIVGTGIDTELLFSRYNTRYSHALKTMFVDENFRVQFLVDADKLDYPLRDSKRTKPTLGDYISGDKEYASLQTLMQRQKAGEEAELLMVHQEGSQAVVAIHYIEALGWYELTFVNVEDMVPNWVATVLVIPLILVVFFTMLLSYFYIVNRWIEPNERLKYRFMKLIKSDQQPRSTDEMFSLVEHELISARTGMEELVASRTEQLDKNAVIDVVTGLYNRQGLQRELRAELARSSREQFDFGLIWIDAGLASKGNNKFDTSKHQSALEAVAESLTRAIREYDVAARWQDDEFLLLVRTGNNDILQQIANRIKQYLEASQENNESAKEWAGNLSIGGTLIKPNLSMQQALALADSSLYVAKSKSNNAIYIHDVSNAA